MGKINVYDKIIIENQKKRDKICTPKKFLHKTSSKISCRNGIHSLLRRAAAKGSADIVYQICDTYRHFVDQA